MSINFHTCAPAPEPVPEAHTDDTTRQDRSRFHYVRTENGVVTASITYYWAHENYRSISYAGWKAEGWRLDEERGGWERYTTRWCYREGEDPKIPSPRGEEWVRVGREWNPAASWRWLWWLN